ncbi:unnamed protein product, partial [Polarella glacialis]
AAATTTNRAEVAEEASTPSRAVELAEEEAGTMHSSRGVEVEEVPEVAATTPNSKAAVAEEATTAKAGEEEAEAEAAAITRSRQAVAAAVAVVLPAAVATTARAPVAARTLVAAKAAQASEAAQLIGPQHRKVGRRESELKKGVQQQTIRDPKYNNKNNSNKKVYSTLRSFRSWPTDQLVVYHLCFVLRLLVASERTHAHLWHGMRSLGRQKAGAVV